jgi:hypothetical protein
MLTIAILISAIPSMASAQTIRNGMLGPAPAAPLAPISWRGHSPARDSIPPNQWAKGMMIGAGVGMVLGGSFWLFANAIGDTAPKDTLLLYPVLILGLLGGMIGAFSRKPG